ncbi:MAG: helix-turn-helix domain-containing protein, partial [Anaerolineaceae bacterium]|nr:helix-turn-helix domain-containing protein [Anaerolineaceae bacterium]
MAKKQREHRPRPETLANLLMPVYEERLEESLGNRLRELRRQQSLSLRALAEKSGLSANTLSLIENGKTSPSVATLQQIALALSIPITSFFEMKVNRDPVVYTQKKQRPSSGFPHGTLEELGTGIGSEGIQPFVVTFNAQADSGPQAINHDGIEFIYCLSGKVIYTILGEEYTLEPGDTIMFSSKIAHSWHNPLDEPWQVMIILAVNEEKRRTVPI